MPMLVIMATSATAQTNGAPGPSPLQQNPQIGATPTRLPPSPTLAPAGDPASLPAPSIPAGSPVRIGGMPAPPAAPMASPAPVIPRSGLWVQNVPGGLPAPSEDPLRIDPATDPILRLAQTQTPLDGFRRAVAQAVRRNPSLAETAAQAEEAAAARDEAQARQYPTADLSLSTFKIVSRAFSNDPGNVLERSRPDSRTDGLIRIQQPVVDFGASNSRIAAAEARIKASMAGQDDVSAQIALRTISVWYNVYGYRALVRLGEVFAESQRDLRARTQERVGQGYAAQGDVAQVDSYVAASDAQLADFRRALANAEAQYLGLVGAPAPADLGRAPVLDAGPIAATGLRDDIAVLPTVRVAAAQAGAARRDADALRSDRLPQLTAGVDAGRYGVIENRRDYDVRANLTLSMRLGGGAAERVRQAEARVHGADARLDRIRQDAERDARIALSDIAALEQARTAIERNYIASRQSRDVLAERFRVSRGTLFDLLSAENNYFGVAARYIQAVTELDTARYVLLARTGRLLRALQIDPATMDTP
ncbi:TolC family protein [Sphingomonas pseudosanguinis]|uniref:TolC family protein n=1 Tax=Sphingomonas pseudosanguinis TaxID=413712 RepID=UPI003F837112